MSLQEHAAQVAQRRFDEIARRHGGVEAFRGKTVIVTDYETEGDLRALKPDEIALGMTLEMQRAINREFARLAEGAGASVRVVVLDAALYLRWLARTGRRNTSDNRAEWIMTQTYGPPPPSSSSE